MKSFADEFKTGTIESLMTKPLSLNQIITGKFLAVWTIGKWMLIPTFIYVISIQSLSVDGRIDFWNLISAYFGLILLTGVFAAIGIFSSSITDSQIIAFLTAMFLMFLFYYGFEGLGSFNLLGRLDLFFQKLSLDYHYRNMIKGLIKISDIVYLLSVMLFFVLLTRYGLQKRIQ